MAANGGVRFNITAFDKTAQAFNAVQNRLNALGKKTDDVSNKFSGAGKALAGAFAAAVVRSLVESTSKLDDFAQRLGISVSSLSELAYVAKMGGVELDSLGNAIRSMEVRLASAADGSGKAAIALQSLGLNATELKNMAPEEAFTKIVQAMSGVENQSDKAKLAMDLFGKSGTELIPIMNGGAESIEALRKDMESLGATIDSEAAQQIAGLGDAWDRLSIAFQGAGRHLLTFFAPALETVVDIMTWVIGKINILLKGLRTFGNAAANVYHKISNTVGLISDDEAAKKIDANRKAMRELWYGTEGASNAAASFSKHVNEANKSVNNISRNFKPISLDGSASRLSSPITKTISDPTFKSLSDIETKTEETAINMRETFRESLQGIGQDFNGLGDVVTNVYSRIRQDMVGKASNMIIDRFSDSVFGVVNGITQNAFRPSGDFVGPVNVPSFEKALGSIFGGFFADGKPIVVGERGPEMIIPERGGTVIPNHALGGKNINITMNIQTPNANSFRQSQSQIAAEASLAIQRATRNT